MGSRALRALGLLLGGTGTVGTVAVTAMPQWRVSAFIESNLIVLEDTWEGLWVHCSRQPNLRMLCQPYASPLALAPALRAARGLMCAGAALAILAVLVAILGMRSTRSTRSTTSTRSMRSREITTRSTGSTWRCWRAEGCGAVAAGLLFLLAAVVELVPLCWVAKSIISDFYDPWVNAVQKRELGQALYLGWGAALCLLAASSVFCCLWSRAGKPRSCGYSIPRHCPSLSETSSSYSKSQYV
ncbi:CLD8 protein, partial [Dasyornis broadbenti]|nr:CLD8 protein [Dasyornis broadbenti]